MTHEGVLSVGGGIVPGASVRPGRSLKYRQGRGRSALRDLILVFGARAQCEDLPPSFAKASDGGLQSLGEGCPPSGGRTAGFVFFSVAIACSVCLLRDASLLLCPVERSPSADRQAR